MNRGRQPPERAVLVLCPRFAPVNAPDAERVRASLRHYPEFGWRPMVLCVDPTAAGMPLDQDLARSLPDWLEVHTVRALPRRWSRLVGLGDVGLRAWPGLARRGEQIIRERGVEVVFASTTAFTALPVARLWKRRQGTPYVIDMHDPWVPEPAPGDSLRRGIRHAAMRWLHRRLEPLTMSTVDGLLSVSDAYLEVLGARYPRLLGIPHRTLAFPADPGELEAALVPAVDNPCFDVNDAAVHGVHAGHVNGAMRPIIDALCTALGGGLAGDPQRRASLKLHFLGTGYPDDGAGERIVTGCARAAGVADRVVEYPRRRPRLEALRALQESDFVILIGKHELAYLPSKAAQCFLTGRPVLCIAPAGGPLARMAAELGCASLVTFEGRAPCATAVRAAIERILRGAAAPVPRERLEPYLPRANAHAQCALLDAVLARRAVAPVPGAA